MSSYPNVVGNTSTPATIALQNKITPQAPLQALVGYLAPKPYIPKPTAPIKKQVITTPNGGTIEHHFDNSSTADTSATKKTASTQQLASTNFSAGGVGNSQDGTNYVRTPSGAVVDATTGELQVPPGAGMTPPAQPAPVSPYFNQANKGLISIGQNGSQGYTDAINAQSKLKQDVAQHYGDIENTPIPLEFQQGREQVLGRQYASQLDAAQQAVNAQQTQQGQQISAFGGAGQLTQPQNNFPFVFNPSTGTYTAPGVGGGQNGGTNGGLTYNPQQDAQTLAQRVIDRTLNYDQAVSAMSYAGSTGVGSLLSAIASQGGNLPQIQARTSTNANSASDLQSKITKIDSAIPSADAAFSVLGNYAKSVGGGTTPVLQGLQQLYGNTLQGSQAVAAFKAQLQTARQAWSDIEGTDGTSALPDNVTASQIGAIQQQLKTDAQNKKTGYQKTLNDLRGGGSSNSTGGGNTGALTWDNI